MPDQKLEKEIRQIRDLLIVIALKGEATYDEVNLATGMGTSNIRAKFPVKRGRKR